MSWVVTSKGDFSVEALLLFITMPVPQDWPEARLCFLWQVSPAAWTSTWPGYHLDPESVYRTHMYVRTVQRSANGQNSPTGERRDEWCRKEISDIFDLTQEPISRIRRECCPRYEKENKLKGIQSEERHGNDDMPRGWRLFSSLFSKSHICFRDFPCLWLLLSLNIPSSL